MQVFLGRSRRLCLPQQYLRLCFKRAGDVTMQTTWDLLWGVFEQYGLPDSILCDNAFSALIGLSWFDARLVRLEIRALHGLARLGLAASVAACINVFLKPGVHRSRRLCVSRACRDSMSERSNNACLLDAGA